jgi:hypothetical protein
MSASMSASESASRASWTRERFEEALVEGRTAALLEKVRGSVFSQRRLEAALDADGLSSTAKTVLARLP